MRAAQHHGIDGGQIVLVEIPVQRAHHQSMVVEPAMLDDLHQIGAWFRKDGVVRLEPVHQHRELPFAQRQVRGGDDHTLAMPLAAVAGDLERGLHADDREIVSVAQRVRGHRGRGVAGDHHGLHALPCETLHDMFGQFAHMLRGFRAIRRVRGITEIQHAFVRHVAAKLTRHRNAAQTGVEYADRCR